MPKGLWSKSVQVCYSAAVLFTFPLQNFPALSIVTGAVHNMMGGGESVEVMGNKVKWTVARSVLCTGVVVGLAFVSIELADSLSHLVSLIGR